MPSLDIKSFERVDVIDNGFYVYLRKFSSLWQKTFLELGFDISNVEVKCYSPMFESPFQDLTTPRLCNVQKM